MIKFADLIEYETGYTVKNKLIYSVPWIEKYRPKKLSQIIHQNEIVKMLENVLETGNLPHLLFYGQAGTGKTSTILAIGMELFGPKKFNERVVELNASDERGINIVRNKIVNIAKSSISTNNTKYKCPPYKIIVLDEADAMTTEAQSALRKVMEDNSNVTRFCFICNYINQIIQPIVSRCVKFRFKPINDLCMEKKLKFIATKENMIITDDAIKVIMENSNGDLRKGIMFLQNLNYLNSSIGKNDVYTIINIIPKEKIDNIVTKCMHPSTSVKYINKIVKDIIKERYPIDNLLKQLNESIITNPHINDHVKSKICIHLSLVDKILMDGGNEYLQLLSSLLEIKKYTQV